VKHKYFIEVGDFGWDYKLVAVKGNKTIQYIQTDWDYPGLASLFGWTPCCHATDGTIACEHKTVSEHLSDASSFLDKHEGEVKLLDLDL